jgi:hypothetical protein
MHVGCVSDNHVMWVREDGKDGGSGTSIVIRPCFRGYLGEQNTGCGAFINKNTGSGASQNIWTPYVALGLSPYFKYNTADATARL